MPDTSAMPAWVAEMRAAAAVITAGELTRFVPPDGARLRESAVLMLFGDGPAGTDLLLTERAHHMRSHPGQVSFPGGSVDPEDASPVETALREAREEVGLDPAGVEVLGTLPRLWLPPSGFAVTPVLAWWRDESPVGVVDADEVHAIYRVPLEHLLDERRRVSVRHPSGWTGPAFLIRAADGSDLVLWGFTAGLVDRFLDHLGWTRPWDPSVVRDLPEHMLGRR